MNIPCCFPIDREVAGIRWCGVYIEIVNRVRKCSLLIDFESGSERMDYWKMCMYECNCSAMSIKECSAAQPVGVKESITRLLRKKPKD